MLGEQENHDKLKLKSLVYCTQISINFYAFIINLFAKECSNRIRRLNLKSYKKPSVRQYVIGGPQKWTHIMPEAQEAQVRVCRIGVA